jgi:O-antigen ligase
LTLSHIGVHAHNIYLEWLADGGIIGLLASAWFSLELFRASLRGVTDARSGSSDRLWRLAIVAALTAWFTHGLLDDFFRYTPTLVAFCMIAGLAASTAAGRTSASSTSKGQA